MRSTDADPTTSSPRRALATPTAPKKPKEPKEPPASAATDRRTAVLEAAMAAFARFGYRKTSMEEVARSARISRPGLYFLFSSKEALFRAAATHTLEQDLAAAESALAEVGRPLEERLLKAFDQWAGRYVGPLSRDIPTVIEGNPDLLGELPEAMPLRFERLITEAVAAEPGAGPAVALAQTLISTSIGLKYQASSREFYRDRLRIAIGLLVR